MKPINDTKTKQKIVIRPLAPVSSMNPVYLQSAGELLYREVLRLHNGNTQAEIKEDGYRLQIHKKGDRIAAFTRSMQPVQLAIYPELTTSLHNLPNCILDTELVGEGVGKKSFDSVQRRFRKSMSEEGINKYLSSDVVLNAPIQLRVFDTLYWEKKSLAKLALEQRRSITDTIAEKSITPSVVRNINDADVLCSWFEELVTLGYEGVVCKDLSSMYHAGQRTTDWIKLKRSETFDLIALGIYRDEKGIAQVLCGTYNNERNCYETLATVNAHRAGLDIILEQRLSQGVFTQVKPTNVLLHPLFKDNPPEYLVPEKSLVVEVAAMNVQHTVNHHSCGYDGNKSYSLRIGWLKRVRDDKAIADIATTSSIKACYAKSQEVLQ